jgi:dipeptidase E
MRLFLASSDLGNHAADFTKLVGANKKVLLIANAQDGSNWFHRTWWLLYGKRNVFRKNGFDATELDLRKYFGKSHELAMFIKNYNPGAIFALGGNAFVLRRAFAKSGFDKILRNDLKKDKYVYGGSSAGSMITSPQLKHYVNPDDMPDVVPKGYDSHVIWNGLGLVDDFIIPHVDAQWFKKSAKIMRAAFKGDGIKPVELKNSDVIIVDGNKKEVLR